MKKSTLVTVVAATILFSGCSQHLGNFTALSTDAYNPANLDRKHLVKRDAESNVASWQVLGFPITGITKLDQAVSDTAHQNGGDFLKNAQVHAYGWSAIIIGQRGYKIKADVYNTQD